jgi:hypothetical protein
MTIVGAGAEVTLESGSVAGPGCEGTDCDSPDDYDCTLLERGSEYVAWGVFMASGFENRLALDGFCMP